MVSEKKTHCNTLLHSVPLDLERFAVLKEQDIFFSSFVLLNMKSVPLCILASSRSQWWGGEIDVFGCCLRMKIVPICVLSSSSSQSPMPITRTNALSSVLQCVAVCCSLLQCVAACCSVLQCAFFLPALPLSILASSRSHPPYPPHTQTHLAACCSVL